MLGNVFGEYGSIRGIRIPTDRDTGQVKGFGYIQYESVEEAQAALEGLNGTVIEGRPVRLDFTHPRDNNNSRGNGRGGGGGGFNSRGGRGGFTPRGGRGGFTPRGSRGGFTPRGGRGGFGSQGGRDGAPRRGPSSAQPFKGHKTTFD